MSAVKSAVAVEVGQRIKQARRQAGYGSAAGLLEKIPEWSRSRLGNYEAGISLPSLPHIERIAEKTGVSPCWLMFGQGPVRAGGPELQAIRHHNLAQVVEAQKSATGGMSVFYKAAGLSRHKCREMLANPFLPISDRLARAVEKFADKPRRWMDEQHAEFNAALPDDLRRILEVYSGLDDKKRRLFRRMAEAFVED